MNNEHNGPDPEFPVNIQSLDCDFERIAVTNELGYLAKGIWLAGVAMQEREGRALTLLDLRALSPIHRLTLRREVESLRNAGYVAATNGLDALVFCSPSTKVEAYAKLPTN